jgi:hypothetical protein
MMATPLLHRIRFETANELSNEIVDVINAHVRCHGTYDPALQNILLAALVGVVWEIGIRVHSDIPKTLAKIITEEGFLPDFVDVDP